MQARLYESARDTGSESTSEKARGRDTFVEGYKAHYAKRQPKEHSRN